MLSCRWESTPSQLPPFCHPTPFQFSQAGEMRRVLSERKVYLTIYPFKYHKRGLFRSARPLDILRWLMTRTSKYGRPQTILLGSLLRSSCIVPTPDTTMRLSTLNGRTTPSKVSFVHPMLWIHVNFLERYFITSSRDMTARIFTLHHLKGFKPKTFAGHRDVVLNAYFSSDNRTVSILLNITRVVFFRSFSLVCRSTPLAGMERYLLGGGNQMTQWTRPVTTKMEAIKVRLPARLRTIFIFRWRDGESANGIISISRTPRSSAQLFTRRPTC